LEASSKLREGDRVLQESDWTFGVFNRIDKLSDRAVAVWCRILAAIVDARLIVKHIALDDPSVRQRLMERFAQHRISPGRITFLGNSDRTAHLRAFDAVDISLDPIPNNGGISTWQSLYMGVPVVAKLGNFTAASVAGSILTAVGLAETVASDDDSHIEIATHLASQPQLLLTPSCELAWADREFRGRQPGPLYEDGGSSSPALLARLLRLGRRVIAPARAGEVGIVWPSVSSVRRRA
jgi:predicted O-linked N-acetylglucosamine transferase (SPINDLY family)